MRNVTSIAIVVASLSLFGSEPQAPEYKIEEILVSYRGTESSDYLAFPSIVRSGDNEILISYKRGQSHARDLGAELEILRIDLESGRSSQPPIRLGMPDTIMQMGEWVRFPNGTLGTYIDAQIVDEKGQHTRIGLRRAMSRDNGKTFESLEAVGVIDGVEYGYLFDTAIVGQRLYALIMTFEYLEGGRRSVDALYTDDNGESWRFVQNLSQEFGDIRINESSLLPYGDGFLIATRSYDNIQRLHRVDLNFKVIEEVDLTQETPSIGSYVGRPRLFRYEGRHFLIGRNWRMSDRTIPMELALFRINPTSLAVERHFVLDNIAQGKVTDGYYPCPILVNSETKSLLNVFDYRGLLGASPDILRMQFDSREFLE